MRFTCAVSTAIFAGFAFVSLPAHADTPAIMMQKCRDRAAKVFRVRMPDVETKYEGQRTDGSHAVNGTAFLEGRQETFQCSFDRTGAKIVQFVVNEPHSAVHLPHHPSTDARVPGTEFHATGTLSCAKEAGQPLSNCRFGVVRERHGSGWVKIFWHDAGNRVIFFEGGRPVRYDQSEADGEAKMQVSKTSDLFSVTIGSQRFEFPEAVLVGG